MVMSFLVPMLVSFWSSRLQLTTVAGYQITGTAKLLIAVTLFLLESLLLRARLTWFLYLQVALQRTSLLWLPNDCKIPKYL